MGKLKGNTPGNNQVQNNQVKSLSKKYKLDKEQQRKLHDYISKEGYRNKTQSHLPFIRSRGSCKALCVEKTKIK